MFCSVLLSSDLFLPFYLVRSLGVHISKVRSLTLDDLDPEEYNLLLRIGKNDGERREEGKKYCDENIERELGQERNE